MAFDKAQWKHVIFQNNNSSVLTCPRCNRGNLKSINGTFHFKESRDSREAHVDSDWMPDWLETRFVMILQCSNNSCMEIITTTGKGSQEEKLSQDNMGNYSHDAISYFIPLYFYPPLNIIEIYEEYPDDLKAELKNSFSHFFSDYSSCANKIRVCVELLLDNLGIKKYSIKDKPLFLNTRIEEYEKVKPAIGHKLSAIKWIGNAGSHYDSIKKDDLIDAFALLDYSLRKIYKDDEKEIEELATAINKSKAPRSKSASKKN